MLNPNKPWLPLAVLTFLLSGVISPLSLSAQAQGLPPSKAQSIEHLLTVTGQGKERIPATLAQVNLGVEAEGKTAVAVQETVASQSTKVVTYLKSKSVDRLQTSSVNLSPNYRYDNGKQTLIGYLASTSITFQVPAAKMSGLLDESVKAGATRITSLSFTATDDELQQAQRSALKKATQDAQLQADAVLAALGLSRQEIIGIQINGASAPPPVYKTYDTTQVQTLAARASSPALPVEAGDQEINASVTLQIRY
jgi:uncharacterized protein